MLMKLTHQTRCFFYVFGLIIPFCLQAVEESLKSVNLFHGGVADKKAGKYSGGMKRRLSVAISLIGDPKVCYSLPSILVGRCSEMCTGNMLVVYVTL